MTSAPLQLLPTDATSPSITVIRLSQAYTGAKLDKLKANYNRWREHADLFLTSCSLRGYVTGRISAPPATGPHALADW